MNYKILLFAFCLLLVKEQALHAQSLKVISYNIHHGADKKEVNTLEEMGAYIKRSRADLVGLQEVDSMCNRSGNVDQMKVLAEITGMYYVFLRHFAYDGGAYGLGILSKYPIDSQQNGKITSMKNGEKKSLGLLGARISLPNGQQLDFATVHYALDQATRMIQAAEALEFFKKDVPAILTGDFNALPGTDEMNLLSQQFKMADENLINTFPTIHPVKKIDFIWTSKENLKKVKKVHIPSIHWSDHLPLEAHLVLNFN
ncbi:endonuclease/exonuclease/phosphatase family protein [uncultured Cyclobacterium sp.]|uniref:endonuclease/exonuclease/phosphatase family protein n=1 Tax=uncultured Cyclobacterium sp. TaxID=453820 RepID=UPI0030EDEBC5|tara:strand:+ start:100494 stop:101264 length:771 start_codon:yes stop_codon:yes gene_type:complete